MVSIIKKIEIERCYNGRHHLNKTKDVREVIKQKGTNALTYLAKFTIKQALLKVVVR